MDCSSSSRVYLKYQSPAENLNLVANCYAATTYDYEVLTREKENKDGGKLIFGLINGVALGIFSLTALIIGNYGIAAVCAFSAIVLISGGICFSSPDNHSYNKVAEKLNEASFFQS